jgi:hypothetical protein
MKIIGTAHNTVDLSVSTFELRIINNALNEVCNGLDRWDFDTRMGASVDEAKQLLREFRAALDAAEQKGSTEA